jgi:hypothetical protein
LDRQACRQSEGHRQGGSGIKLPSGLPPAALKVQDTAAIRRVVGSIPTQNHGLDDRQALKNKTCGDMLLHVSLDRCRLRIKHAAFQSATATFARLIRRAAL